MEPAPGYRLLKLYRALLAPALAALDAETAHHLAIAALRAGLLRGPGRPADPRLRVRLAGLDLPGPLGIAAGFDKNGEVADALLALGFGFVEIGTVTPRPQAGNPKPRMFRLVEDARSSTASASTMRAMPPRCARLRARAGRAASSASISAPTRIRRDRIADYVAGITRFADLASYFTVNISSPNTPGLRDLQGKAALAELLARVLAAATSARRRRERACRSSSRSRPTSTRRSCDDIAARCARPRPRRR